MGKKRVLVVEDDALLAQVVRRLLSAHAVVVVVPSAHRAVQLLVHEDWDVVLCDLQLGPESPLDGIDVLQAVEMLAPHARRVLYSATPQAVLPPHVDAFVCKPFSVTALLEALGLDV